MFKQVDGGLINTDEDSYKAFELARNKSKRDIFVIETLQKIDRDIAMIKQDIAEIKVSIKDQ